MRCVHSRCSARHVTAHRSLIRSSRAARGSARLPLFPCAQPPVAPVRGRVHHASRISYVGTGRAAPAPWIRQTPPPKLTGPRGAAARQVVRLYPSLASATWCVSRRWRQGSRRCGRYPTSEALQSPNNPAVTLNRSKRKLSRRKWSCRPGHRELTDSADVIVATAFYHRVAVQYSSIYRGVWERGTKDFRSHIQARRGINKEGNAQVSRHQARLDTSSDASCPLLFPHPLLAVLCRLASLGKVKQTTSD